MTLFSTIEVSFPPRKAGPELVPELKLLANPVYLFIFPRKCNTFMFVLTILEFIFWHISKSLQVSDKPRHASAMKKTLLRLSVISLVIPYLEHETSTFVAIAEYVPGLL